MPNLNPLIESIARLVGIAGETAAKAAEKVNRMEKPMRRSAPGSAVTSMVPEAKIPTDPPKVGRSTLDVEKWLGESLKSDPVKQTKVVHDYLRGAAALEEASSTKATHVREISVPVWEATQRQLQQHVDADPEVQDALRRIYIGKNTEPDPTIRSVVMKDPNPVPQNPVSNVVPENAPKLKRRPIAEGPTRETVKVRDKAWKDLTDGIEAQNPDTIAMALEQIHSLEPAYSKAAGPTEQAAAPEWQKAVEYMQGLEKMAAEMQQNRVPREEWAPQIAAFRESSGVDFDALPPRIRNTVERIEAWTDAMKPASLGESVGQVAGVPRALMSSFDLSAPGRQGLLMVSRPEYWAGLKDMVRQFKSPEFYAKHQEALKARETFPVMQEAGLAITGLEGQRLTIREEAFRSNLAEKIPVIGEVVKASERGYVGFLNDLRANVFDTQLQLFKNSGLLAGDGGPADQKLLKDLAEWINTSTGRGSLGKWDPGLLNTILFSPRLAVSRAQTFNPQYYWKLDPAVRKEALKANMSAAALVVSLVSLAGLGGAKVTWDFRNPDAGKIRIGDTRIDLGGGHFQMLKFMTQIATAQKINSGNGKVTKLGEGSAHDQSRFDLLVNFVVSKEAPVASLITTALKGKGGDGKPISWWKEIGSRLVPLAVQDAYEAIGDTGVGGLLLAPLAFVGAGIQTYDYKPKMTIPFLGVDGVVPEEKAVEFEQQMMKAESDGIANAMQMTGWDRMSTYEQEKVTHKMVDAERMKARQAWITANAQAYAQAVKEKRLNNGSGEFPLVAPEASNVEQQ